MVRGSARRRRSERPPLRGLTGLRGQRLVGVGHEQVGHAERVHGGAFGVDTADHIDEHRSRAEQRGRHARLLAEFAPGGSERVLAGEGAAAGWQPGTEVGMAHEQGVCAEWIHHPCPAHQLAGGCIAVESGQHLERTALHLGPFVGEQLEPQEIGATNRLPGTQRGTGRSRCPFGELLVAQSLMLGSMNSLVTMSDGTRPSLGVAPWASYTGMAFSMRSVTRVSSN